MSLFTSFRYLLALHQHRHFGRAAEACHITQPALSNAIRALEQEFGTAIVKRGRSFESFTPEGERILITAQRVMHEQSLLKQDLQSSLHFPVGSLTLGAVPTVMPIAARFAGWLNRRHPGLCLSLRSMSSPEIEAGLENLSIDLALGYTDRIKVQANGIHTLAQYEEHYFLLRRHAESTLAGLHISKQTISWSDSAQFPLCLLTPEMHNRSIVDAAFKRAGAILTPAIETNSIMALGLTVLDGEVCAILPGALVSALKGYSGLEALLLTAPEVATPIGFMFVGSDRQSHALRAALEFAATPDWLAHVAQHAGALS
jgi:DNA-binding transcriptional LysR family regulator